MSTSSPGAADTGAEAQKVFLFGIRHHGPGSSRYVVRELERLSPDCVLLEGPADASDAIRWVNIPGMEPPVALLLYVPERPNLAVFFPMADFSPEWQAMRFALERQVPVRFMDLPQSHQLAFRAKALEEAQAAEGQPVATESTHEEQGRERDLETELETETGAGREAQEAALLRQDPLGYLARAAGYTDSERWWDLTFEQRRDSTDVPQAILDAMTALRESLPAPEARVEARGEVNRHDEQEAVREAMREAMREAYMRQSIRQALSDGFKRIAVVCGAWHTPALVNLEEKGKGRGSGATSARADAALLKGLPKIKVAFTWIPWTFGRLSRESGYGAGIASPGWYDHLWHHPEKVSVRWLARVASTLRRRGLDASSASVIEAVRLAEALASLRLRQTPDLEDLSDASLSVLCHGDSAPLALIRRELLISERLGSVPPEVPSVPLVTDLERCLKHLRMKRSADTEDLELDLREAAHLEKSHLLHRLGLLGIPWGTLQAGKGRGTYWEVWKCCWQPEFSVKVIEAGVWGNTLLEAATANAVSQALTLESLPELTTLLRRVLLSDLPSSVPPLVHRLQATSAVSTDVRQLIAALPPLADVVHYGDVRQTDASSVRHVLDGFLSRICIGLPGACASLDDDAALSLMDLLTRAHGVVEQLAIPEHLEAFAQVLAQLATQEGVHGRVRGRALRLLLDGGRMSPEDAGVQMGLLLSPSVEPDRSAAWLEGFLWGSGLLLIHDSRLFGLLDAWLGALSAERFIEVLPLLRRVFSPMPAPERRQIGEKAARRARFHQAAAVEPSDDGMDIEASVETVSSFFQELGYGNAPLMKKERAHES